MNKYTRPIRVACGVWLLILCIASFPWGLAYAAPVILAHAVTRRKDWCCQVSLASGCVSLLFSVYFLIRYVCWKAAGNYDAQEAIGFVFLFIYQFGLSLVAMLLTWCFCAGYRNMSTPYNKNN